MERAQAAMLTPSRLIAIHRLMKHDDWPVFFDLLKANFPLDDPVFVRSAVGAFDALDACKRDGQRDVLLFVRQVSSLPTPSETEETNDI